MATTLSAGKLKVTINENVVINGMNYGSANTYEIPSIASVLKRIINVPTDEITLYETDATAVAGAKFDEDNVKYVRVTNKDNSAGVELIIKNDRNEECSFLLAAYTSFILWSHKDAMDANQAELSFVDATCDFTASSTTATCDASAKIKVGQNVNAVNVPNRTVATVNTPGAVTSFTMSGVANDAYTNHSTTFTQDLADITSIVAKGVGAAVDVELFVASTN
tara:strand:- start:3301 stop:3966 length:666 start_codon:yes stop_codon:yes gene_type:complete